MNSLRLLFFSIILFIAQVFSGVNAAYASYGIMPMESQVQIQKDSKQVTDDIEVYNGTDTPLFITGSIISWKLTPKGEYEYSTNVDEPQSCASWIRLNPEQFVVPAQKSVRVRYTVTPPANFTEEHRAMIFFQSRPVPHKKDGLSLNVIIRMGCKVFVQPAQLGSKKAEIANMKFENAVQPRLQVAVKNTGTATCRAGGTVQIFNEQGALVTSGELQPKSVQILPEFTRLLDIALEKPLPPGQYRIKAVIDYGAKQLLGGELATKVAAPENSS